MKAAGCSRHPNRCENNIILAHQNSTSRSCSRPANYSPAACGTRITIPSSASARRTACGPGARRRRPSKARIASAHQACQRLRRPPLCSGPTGDTPGPLRLSGWLWGRPGLPAPSPRPSGPRKRSSPNAPRSLLSKPVYPMCYIGPGDGALRSPFEPPSKSPCRAVALLRLAPPSHTPA